MKKHALLIAIISLCLLIFGYALSVAPKTIDWRYSFSLRHKKPFGCDILRAELQTAFPGKNIANLYHDYTNPKKELAHDGCYNLILIDNELNLTNAQWQWLLNEAGKGNHILLSAESLPQILLDTLKFKIIKDSTIHLLKQQKANFSLNHKQDSINNHYHFEQNITNHYLEGDSMDVLSTNEINQPVYIKKQVGEGALYIHCNPLVFSNYHMLANQNYIYGFECLAQLPMADTYWDEYHKTVNRTALSPIMYIHHYPLLKQAWYFLWIILVIYLWLEIRRRQRPIPTLAKPVNSTLEFVKTMGRLYLARRDHRDIALKKYLYFKDFVKRKYHLSFDVSRQEEEMVALSEKSGLPLKSIRQIVDIGQKINHLKSLTEGELIHFNRTIEFFYNNCK